MENSSFISNKNKLEFREIVLTHIKKILEIGSKELRDTTYIISHANHSETRYQEDTRKSYIQSIENLAYILLPYFDKKAQNVFDECIEIMNAYNFDLEDNFKDEVNKILKKLGTESIGEIYSLNKKIEYAKKLFVELNLLLKRVDYLKGIVYGEEGNDPFDVDRE
jgi:hypothetical protein